MAKNIYWICGYLHPEERDQDFLKYGLILNNSFKELARRDPALRDFKFINLYSCTKQEFLRIWSDPDTYGIFWNSHGSQNGYPQADPDPHARTWAAERQPQDLKPRPQVRVVRARTKQELRQLVDESIGDARARGLPYVFRGYDDSRVVRLEDGRYEIEVLVGALPYASPNLRFLAILSCAMTDDNERAWRLLMPRGAEFPRLPRFTDTAPGSHGGFLDLWTKGLKAHEYLLKTLSAGARQSRLPQEQGAGLVSRLLQAQSDLVREAARGLESRPLRAAPMVPGTIYSDLATRKTYEVDPLGTHRETAAQQALAIQQELGPAMQALQARFNPVQEAARTLTAGKSATSNMPAGTTYSDLSTRKTFEVDALGTHRQTGSLLGGATHSRLGAETQTFQARSDPVREAARGLQLGSTAVAGRLTPEPETQRWLKDLATQFGVGQTTQTFQARNDPLKTAVRKLGG